MSTSAALFEDELANERTDSSHGLQIGAVVARELHPLLALQIELLFSQKGWKEQNTGGGRRLTYLDLPILLSLSPHWKTSPQLLVGPHLGYELKASATEVPGAGGVSLSNPRVEWERAKFLTGVSFGLGVRQRIGNGTLSLQFLGNLTLTDINHEPLPRGYLRLITLTPSVLYQVPLGRR